MRTQLSFHPLQCYTFAHKFIYMYGYACVWKGVVRKGSAMLKKGVVVREGWLVV